MLYALAITNLLIILIFILWYIHRKKKFRKLNEIIEKWGKTSNADRNFGLIGHYHNCINNKPDEYLSDEVAEDIDLERIFAFVDRTNSRLGQQYLYHQLRKIHPNLPLLHELDDLATKFKNNDDLRISMEVELIRLEHRNAYYIHELFTSTYDELYQKWLAIYIKIAGFLWIIACTFTIIGKDQYLFLLTLGLTFFNFYIYFTNKNKIARYTHSLPQIYLLMKVAKNCSDLLKNTEEISKKLKNLAPLKKVLGYINFQSGSETNDISAGVFELIKALLLIEPAMFLISLHKIKSQKANIETLFNYVAKIDTAISIQSLRISLPYYTKPNFTDGVPKLDIEALYHPLIENCIPNSIHITAQQGTLITGSNMSGKTTFIRSIVINALLSQTLFTSVTKSYNAPFLNLFTSIRINDNLEENQSYFQTEALSVLHIVNESDQKSNNLIIIDEIFRGTNTIERIAAAKAILSYLTNKNNFVFVSTHDLELAELLGNEYRCYSFEEKVTDTRLVFDYKIKPGILKNKNGIAILAAMGYPQAVVEQANEISLSLREKYNL